MTHNTEQLWTEIREMRADVAELRQEVTKYKGFIGGVLFTASAVGTFIGILIGFFSGK